MEFEDQSVISRSKQSNAVWFTRLLKIFFSITLLSLLLFQISSNATENRKISANEANAYVGQMMTVCGYLASSRLKGQPTFLNLDGP
jgi:hypothetical protein